VIPPNLSAGCQLCYEVALVVKTLIIAIGLGPPYACVHINPSRSSTGWSYKLAAHLLYFVRLRLLLGTLISPLRVLGGGGDLLLGRRFRLCNTVNSLQARRKTILSSSQIFTQNRRACLYRSAEVIIHFVVQLCLRFGFLTRTLTATATAAAATLGAIPLDVAGFAARVAGAIVLTETPRPPPVR
jgi:hypothetical protein